MAVSVTPTDNENPLLEEVVDDITKVDEEEPLPSMQIMEKLEKNRRGSLDEFTRMSIRSGRRRTSLYEESNKPSKFNSYTRGQLFGLVLGPVLCIALCFVPISEEYPKAQLMVGENVKSFQSTFVL